MYTVFKSAVKNDIIIVFNTKLHNLDISRLINRRNNENDLYLCTVTEILIIALHRSSRLVEDGKVHIKTVDQQSCALIIFNIIFEILLYGYRSHRVKFTMIHEPPTWSVMGVEQRRNTYDERLRCITQCARAYSIYHDFVVGSWPCLK